MNALVISHLRYPAILLYDMTETFLTTLEKQLNWAIEACFNITKVEFPSDLKSKKFYRFDNCSGQDLQFTTGSIEKD